MGNFIKPNILLIPVFLLMIFLGRKICQMDFPITDFTNITLSLATLRNVDISKAALWYLVYVLPLYDKVKNFLCDIKITKNETTLFLMIILFSVLILGTHDGAILILASCFALISLFGRNDEVGVATWLSSLYIFSIPFFCLSQYIHRHPEHVFFIFAIISSIYFCLAKNFSTIFTKLYPFLLASISSFILLNVLEILSVRGFSVSVNFLFVPYILAALACIFLKFNPEKNYERKILRGTIILMVLSATPALGYGGYIDFFEGANHGLSIQAFIQYGDLPLINNLDAHMLSYTLSGIIWFALTGDYVGAMLSPYASMILNLIAYPSLFYLMTKFLTERQAFIILAFFPFVTLMALFGGCVTIPVLIFWKNNPNFFRSLIVQITISALCLYRIDLGASFGFALFLCPIIFCIIHKEYRHLRDYFIAAILWASAFFAVVFFGLNFEFVKEFFTAFNSNQHWAYGDLGDSTRVAFIYFIVPAVTAILFLPIIRRILNKKDFENDWLILFLYATFIFGISRMMARHTMIEFNPIIFAAEFLLLAFLLINFCKAYKAVVFIVTFFLLMVSGTNAPQLPSITFLQTVNAAINSVHNEQRQYFSNFTAEDVTQIDLMKNFFDENLLDDETYFDFTDQSLFFVATNRKNPIYINQCPAMINGVKGQLQALSQLEMKKSKVKFVVIWNCDRYYLLTEWICKNYQPYTQVGNFFVWKLKDTAQNPLNYNYELPGNHFHNLGYIPYLWGQSSIQAVDTEIPSLNNGVWNLTKLTGKVGFITLEISSEVDSEVNFKVKGSEINEIIYQFKINQGTHLYRFRISSDILWYSGKIETLEVENFHVNKIYFEEVSE